MKTIQSFNDVTVAYENGIKGELSCYCRNIGFTVTVDNIEYNVYDAYIGDQQISLYADNGVLCYTVDIYHNHGNIYTLFDITE